MERRLAAVLAADVVGYSRSGGIGSHPGRDRDTAAPEPGQESAVGGRAEVDFGPLDVCS